MMKARKPSRKVPPPPPDVDALIKRLEAAADDELVDVLRPVQLWCFARGDMYSWAAVIKRFVSLLSSLRDKYALGAGTSKACKLQVTPFSTQDKELIMAILGFMRLLLDNCTNRKMFDGYEVMNDLLLTSDLDVLHATLAVFLRPLQQYLTQMPTSPELTSSIRARLLPLTRGWDRFHLAECSLVKYASTDGPIGLPDASAQLQLQFYVPVDPAAPEQPPAKSAVTAPQDTPTRPALTTARSEQRLALPAEGNMVNLDLGNIAKAMTPEDYLSRLETIVEENRMQTEDQLVALNKTRLILLTASRADRQKLLACRLLALACYIFYSDQHAVQSDIFLCEPELTNEIAELLVPEHDVGENVVAAALHSLDAASRHRPEVLSSINAHVSHGIIMSLLNSVVNKLSEGQAVSHDIVDALFTFLAYVNSLPLHGNLLIGAGLIPLLLKMLDAKGERRELYIPRASGLIDSAYFTHPQALQAFTNADGLNVLVSHIKAEVQMTIDTTIPEDPIFNKESLIAYNTSPLKAELRSVYRMLQSTGGSDGFRNVVDTDLPKSLKLIFTHAARFGTRNFGIAVNIMSTIVHNEPTALSILQESNLPQTLYEVLEKDMPDAFELVYTLPNAIGAICLNSTGLQATIDHFDVIRGIMRVALSWSVSDYSDRDSVTTIGQSLDELVRHHPRLRPLVCNAAIDFLHEAMEEGKSFKPVPKEINDYPVDPSQTGSAMEIDDAKDGEDKESDSDKGMITNPPLAKITNVLKLLSVLLRNSNTCREFLGAKGLDLVLKIGDLPCVPCRFSRTDAATVMPAVLRAIGEHENDKLADTLVQAVSDDLKALPELWQGSNVHEAWLEMTRTSDVSEAVLDRLRSSAGLAIRLSFLAEYIHMHYGSNRAATSLIKSLGVSAGSPLVTNLGDLHRACFIEHVLFKEIGASDAAEYAKSQAAEGKASTPSPQETVETSLDPDRTEHADHLDTGAISPTPTGIPPSTTVDLRPPTRVQMVKTLVTRFHAILTRFFKATIRLIFHKRVPEAAHKQEAAALANCVADIIIKQLNASADLPEKQLAIDTVTLGLSTILLYDDRGAEGHIHTTLFIPFDKKGGMTAILDNMRRILSHMSRLSDIPVEEDKRSQQEKDEHAQLSTGVRFVVSALAGYVSSRAIVDSPQTRAIEQREISLPSKARFSAINALVGLRRDCFPVAKQIWEAPWLGLLPLPILRLAVQTFLQIMAGKHEEREVIIAPDVEPPMIREVLQPRAPPTADPARVAQLVDMGFGQHAAQRALVRARNNVAGAADLLLSHPHLFPNDASPPTATPAVEPAPAVEASSSSAPVQEAAAADAPAAESSTAATAAEASATEEPKKEEEMEIDDAPSPSVVWEQLHEELTKLRAAEKPKVAPRAMELLDAVDSLVHDLLEAFPEGNVGLEFVVERLEEAVNQSPLQETIVKARLRLFAIWARQSFVTPPECSEKLLQRAMGLIMTLPADSKPRPAWIALYLLAAESVFFMSTTVVEAKLGDEVNRQVVRSMDFGDAPARLLATCVETVGANDLSREETLSAMRLAVVLTRSDSSLSSAELMRQVLVNFKNPTAKLAGSYPYVAMLARHAMDDKSSLLEVIHREIREWMSPQRNKVPEVTYFIRQLRNVAYRDPNTFLNAVEEECALVDPGPSQSVYHIRSKHDSKPEWEQDAEKNKDEAQDKDTTSKGTKPPASSGDPFQRSVIETFANQPVMDYLVSELGSTIRSIHHEEAENSGASEEASRLYSYAGLILSLVTELVGSYMSAKKAFLAAVRHGSVYGGAKGKSGFATVLSDLVCCVSLADVQRKASDETPEGRRVSLSSWSTSLLIALCGNIALTFDAKDLPEDLSAVRKIVIDGIAKALKDSVGVNNNPNARYGRLWALGELIHRLLTSRTGVVPRPTDNTGLQLAKAMLEKNFVGIMTSTVSEVDLNYPDIRRVLVSLLRALEHLTKVSNKWGKKDQKPSTAEDGEEDETEDSDSSHTSDEEMDEDMTDDEGPDLYRNSALGILGGDMDVDEEEDMDSSDMEDDDDLMEAFADEMDHDMDDDEGTEPSDDSDEEDVEIDGGSDMEGDWSTEDEDEGDDGGEEEPVIDVGAEFDEEEEVGVVPWEDEDGRMDDDEPEEFDEGEEFLQPFGMDYDPDEDEGLEDFGEEDGYEEMDFMEPSSGSSGGTASGLAEGNGYWGWRDPVSRNTSANRSRLMDMDTAASTLFGFPSRGSASDSISHPLLAAPRTTSMTGRTPNNPFGSLSSATDLLSSIEGLGGPAAVQFLQNIVSESRSRGAESLRVDLAHRQDGGFGLSIGGHSFTVPPPPRELPGNATEMQAQYEPRPTPQRWQEEQMLFPYTSPEQVARLTVHIINRLMPAAKKAAAEEAERLRKEEAEEAERARKAETEAAERVAKDRDEETVNASLVALPDSRPDTALSIADDEDVEMVSDDEDDDEDMDDDEDDDGQPRVTVVIHGEEIDITNTGIDLEFLEALPEDMRAEVVEQHLREQSRNTGPPPPSLPEASMLQAEFLNALPPEIRAEVIMQESLEQAREQARRTAAAVEPAPAAETRPATGAGGAPSGTLLDLEMEVRGLLRGDELRDVLAHTIGIPPGLARKIKNTPLPEKRPLQLLDKPGIASLVRLLFFPSALQGGYLFRTLVNLCENSETLADLLQLLLSIVQDGSADLQSVDRSFQQMSLRGLIASPKTPITPKGKAPETTGSLSTGLFAHLQADHIPTFIAQRCFEALSYIVNANRNAVSYFLTEHDLPVGLKKHGSKKGKGKEKFIPQTQYPIVILMGLLDRTELLKAPGMMESLTGLLAAITKPLALLHNWRTRVEKNKQEKKAEEEAAASQAATAEGAADSEATDATQPKEGTEAGWTIERPMFSPSVLRLVVNCITVGDCTSRTFSQTLMLLQHLSSIPEARQVLVQELCTQAQHLGGVVQDELADLAKLLLDKKHDITSAALVKFSPASSSQAQLLRILKTIDYLHSRKSSDTEATKAGELTQEEKRGREIHESFDFAAMWQQLGDCLTLAEERESTEQIAAVLLPLVEALMVVCKYTRPPQSQIDLTVSPTLSATHTPPPGDLFLSFTTTHRKVLNAIVRNNPSLMSGSFSLLVANPRVLEFDNKRNWFFQKLKRKRDQQSYPALHLNVRRQYVFQDSFSTLLHRPAEEVKYGKINVKFINEEGVDAGGVTREWYHVLATQIFNPDFGLFEPCAADKQTYQPNKHSSIANDDHLSFFKFVGRVIGKAIFDGRLLDAYFNRAFYKQILGRSVEVRDLESIDPEYHKSLQWMLDNDITDIIDQEFTIEDDSFGAKKVVELKPGGAQIPVTEENKAEYVRLVVAYRLEVSIKAQMNAFLTGFYEIIPRHLIQIFEPDQLELLISGLTTVDVDELKNSTQLAGWKTGDPEIAWFWRALRSFSQEERSRFLIFVTASSRVPLGGFGQLQGASGTQPFQIQQLYGKTGILPQASTCFNLLLLPKYESYEQMREKLLFAVTETSGFGKS